ncbi:hypothetical protein AYL99_11632 [Fonsecaea erecta]|uniref:Inositol monophosphatase n=1 Tax=Fonsecaea erecta TaxID=1367422 RepID=A0A178Z2Z7_9EURO|nr:hypothetical protein AYL99_11632 [Fonsecaea erecta]OAP54097.1 hypothetical protein AYL99_11632 [Fonsecaea erecta]
MAISLDRRELEQVAFNAAKESMSYIESVTVGNEGPFAIAAAASRIVQTHITNKLRDLFPTDNVLDAPIEKGTSGRTWVVKPIDSVTQFVEGKRDWVISFGLFDGKRPIFGVAYVPGRARMISGGAYWPPTLNGNHLQEPSPFPPDRRLFFAVSWEIDKWDSAFLELAEHNAMFRFREGPVQTLVMMMAGFFDGYISDWVTVNDLMGSLPILRALGLTYDIAPAGGKGVKVQVGRANRGPVRGVLDDHNCLARLINEQLEENSED